MENSSPIGVFDSGLGGLSVLRCLVEKLPGEDFLYLGDNARLPYGTKSRAVVSRYAGTCSEFLIKKGIKALVIACNTATAMALESLQKTLPIPVFGVIEPGVQACLSTEAKKAWVLATPSTVKSESYLKEFQKQAPEMSVKQIACPLLVPLAEEGWFDHEVTATIIRSYLGNSQAPEVILLGCTHYPLLETAFRKVVPSIPIVHGGFILANQLAEKLESSRLKNPKSGGGKVTFFATDSVSDNPILNRLFPGASSFQTVDL